MSESTPTMNKPSVAEDINNGNTPSVSQPSTGAVPSVPEAGPTPDFVSAPAQYIQARFISIILWDKPVQSGLSLAGSIALLVLTQYYSLLQILAGLATVVIGINWVYVNAYVLGHKAISGTPSNKVSNPHKARIQAPKALVSRDKVVLASNLLVDIVEAFTSEATKIVLIEDNFKSLRYLATFFIVWSVSKYVATIWIVGAGLIFIFSLPKLYLQHQEKIDHHVAQSSERAKILATQYSEIAKQRASGVYGQAVNATRRVGQSKKKQN
ncbi:hypothetical protein NQZ79_g3272 [Umbelopsis isabellina]|nr:hypothetical protein NQZ79_g3272 [Umbelopsis isabellina]